MGQLVKRLTRVRAVVWMGAALVFVLLPGLVAAHADTEPVVDAVFPVDDAVQAPFDAHQLVLDFAPGAAAPLHRHGGPGYITMLSGELTLVADGDERVYRAGNDFVEVPESTYEGWNATDVPARLMVTYLVPEGHDVTTYIQAQGSRVQQAPAPVPVTQSVFNITSAPDRYQVIHRVLELGLDQWSTVHDELGQTFVTVVEGELTARDAQGGETSYQAGDTLVEQPGAGQSLGNTGNQPVAFVATLLLPAGEAEAGWSRYGAVAIIVAAGGIGITGGGLLLRRRIAAG